MKKADDGASVFWVRLRQGLHDLSALPGALRIAWAAAKPQAIAWIGLLVGEALVPVGVFYLIRALVNAVAGGVTEIEELALLLVSLAGLLLVREALSAVSSLVRTSLSEHILDFVKCKIHETATKTDFGHFESPVFFDRLHRANYESSDATVAVVESIGTSLRGCVSLVAMVAILFPYAAWLPGALLLSMVPIFYVVVSHAYRYHHWWRISTARERRAAYYDWLMTSSEGAAEIRLFQIGDRLRDAYQSLKRQLRTERIGLERRNALAVGLASLFTIGVTSGSLVAILVRVLAGSLTFGDLVLCYQAFNQGQSVARTLVTEIGSIMRSSLYMKDLLEFLHISPSILPPVKPVPFPSPLQSGIVFRNVDFYYPGSDRPALQDFNLELPANRTTAILGMNGAGKSTLLKLICRFYDPQAGSVEMDGIDLRDLDPECVRKAVSILFQDPVHYQFSVSENIDITRSSDQSGILDAAQAAKADPFIDRLPQGYQTVLGKWFLDGHELSGGEWQRIALARAFLQNAPILILDEPTSAMDPWMEAEWLDSLNPLISQKTAIIITHRLAVARRAHQICVVHDGMALEKGSHEELLENPLNLYSKAWQRHVDRAY